ncbi:MAG: competence/damage-inducible protein A [archaeon]|nr:competence/damage-inducible protein A [archaeon]
MEYKIGLIAVGDELLAGHILDTNTNWLLKRLQKMNHEVQRVEIVPDEIKLISNSVKRFIDECYNVIFIYGGLGPTHDDITFEGIALALDRKCIENQNALNLINEQYMKYHKLGILRSSSIEEIPGAKKMAIIPEGAKLLKPTGTAPGLFIEIRNKNNQNTNIFVLPGVPLEFKSMFKLEIKNKLFKKNPEEKYISEIITKTEEARLFSILSQAKHNYPEVKIGSYPNIEEMHVLLRLTGKKNDVEAAKENIKEKISNLGPG